MPKVISCAVGYEHFHLCHLYRRALEERCGEATQNVVEAGLRLALIRSLFQHLNGTIAATSFPMAKGYLWENCFTLILPKSLLVEI